VRLIAFYTAFHRTLHNTTTLPVNSVM